MKLLENVSIQWYNANKIIEIKYNLMSYFLHFDLMHNFNLIKMKYQLNYGFKKSSSKIQSSPVSISFHRILTKILLGRVVSSFSYKRLTLYLASPCQLTTSATIPSN